ncbi:DNA repair protein RecN [Desulfovirgula thermocuniculi]|uniref:DNA repair protein RecN n=1 Tax=Desulfovirgula thermocuniculi TaxID=348842 RepID=UPI000489EAAA|nr:DNA repair protein RecN [Desulfovirgula thermocuniculi]
MLVSLDIRDFGLIDHQSIEFGPGLNVLTGETGAGKSILVEALQVALGGRAWSEYIRTGREKARVTAVFALEGLAALKERLAAWGVLPEDDGLLIMSRELSRSGRNLCRLNGQPVPLSLYREVGSSLVDIHGQHENQSLFSPEKHRDLLDRFGGLWPLREEVAALYRHWRSISAELEEWQRGTQEKARRMDMLSYQIKEIDRACLVPGEEEELARERQRLANAEKIAFLAGRCYAVLYGGSGGAPPVVDLLGGVRRDLEELARLDGEVATLLAAAENALYQVEDLARELSRYREGVEHNPLRLQQVEERLARIKELKRKYGSTVEEILRYREEAAAELEALSTGEERVAALGSELRLCREEWEEKARALSQARRQAAAVLEREVMRHLGDLEMEKAAFRVLLEELDQPSAAGRERVEFLISPNPGEPLRPLAKFISGGELSRVMLAIRAILAGVDELPTLVFDEVDTGLGGKALVAVGEKLAEIASRRQVICITHAAQVASLAETHWRISKVVREGQTLARLEKLDEGGRLAELARMLSGQEEDFLAREHARHLLNLARRKNS